MFSNTIYHLRTVFLSSTFLIMATSVFSQTLNTTQLEKRIEQYMNASLKHDYFSGSILIAKNGKPIYRKGYGMANIEHQVPNTIHTVFLIGSIAKQFTAMAIMQLVEQGKLNVSDSLHKHLPNCPPAWKAITIRNLLTQTSGIMNYSRLADWDEKHSIQPYTPTEVIDLIRYLPLQFNPGDKFNYSNTNYELLGLIIEKASGISYHDFLEKNIFSPLGMKNTGATNPSQLIPNRAAGYYTKLNSFVNAPYENSENSVGSGSLLSTLADLLLWDQALYTTKLVSRKTLDEMSMPNKGNYGYGTEIYKMFDKITIGHAGSQSGFSTILVRLPEENITVIVLSNSDKASGGRVAKDLLAIMLNKPYKIPEISVSEMLSVAYEKGGTESTLQIFKELKTRDGEKLEEEEVLGNLGGDLLDLKKVKDAIKIFMYIIETKPKSSYGHDYLGDAYLREKNYEMAMIYFKKALVLDPTNKYAITGIKKVEDALKTK
jgi:CubicO group peptidase (beta-lactamase class C family)